LIWLCDLVQCGRAFSSCRSRLERVTSARAFFGTHKNKARVPVQVSRLPGTTRATRNMSLSQFAAGRARSFEPSVFTRESVGYTTKSEATPNPPSSPYAWKFALARRIGSAEGPSSVHARYALRVLIDHSDADGRTWLGIQALLTNTAIKTERTMRKVLDKLVRGGWLRITPHTWTSLTAEQAAIGRTLPRRGDAGQAPNLYVVLDGRGREACLEGRSRPGIVRTS